MRAHADLYRWAVFRPDGSVLRYLGWTVRPTKKRPETNRFVGYQAALAHPGPDADVKKE